MLLYNFRWVTKQQILSPPRTPRTFRHYMAKKRFLYKFKSHENRHAFVRWSFAQDFQQILSSFDNNNNNFDNS